MQAGDVIAVIAGVLVAVLTGAFVAMLVLLTNTLRRLRATADALNAELLPLLDDVRAAVKEAGTEIERVDRLVTSAEKVTDAVDGAQRLAYRTIGSPVVKAMAFGTGVSRAAQRLREGEPPPPAKRRRGVTRRRRAS